MVDYLTCGSTETGVDWRRGGMDGMMHGADGVAGTGMDEY
jgi:hypothetical protein